MEAAVGKRLWKVPVTVEGLNEMGRGNMAAHLGIAFIEVGDDYLNATMPVDHRTQQPFGLLHGGASVVLAETLGSVGASLTVDMAQQYCVGIEINANHVRAVREGTVTGTARPLKVGGRIQVWEIHLHDERQRLVCASRLTLAVLDQ